MAWTGMEMNGREGGGNEGEGFRTFECDAATARVRLAKKEDGRTKPNTQTRTLTHAPMIERPATAMTRRRTAPARPNNPS